jgi:hypothetical protein
MVSPYLGPLDVVIWDSMSIPTWLSSAPIEPSVTNSSEIGIRRQPLQDRRKPTSVGKAHGHELPCHDHRALPLLFACLS